MGADRAGFGGAGQLSPGGHESPAAHVLQRPHFAKTDFSFFSSSSNAPLT
jgi:hypothetical protein